MKNSQKGFAVTVIMIFVLAIVIGISYFIYKNNKARIQESEKKTVVADLTIDQLKNIEIPDFIGSGDGVIQLKDGSYDNDISGNKTEFHTSIALNTDPNSYFITDIDGDGASDIVATLTWSGGGTGNFTELVVFKNSNGVPKYVTSQGIGDRIYINKISFENGIILGDIITQGPNEPLCCGSTRRVLMFKLEGNKLAEIKKFRLYRKLDGYAYLLGDDDQYYKSIEIEKFKDFKDFDGDYLEIEAGLYSYLPSPERYYYGIKDYSLMVTRGIENIITIKKIPESAFKLSEPVK
jgi:hypothetical protein